MTTTLYWIGKEWDEETAEDVFVVRSAQARKTKLCYVLDERGPNGLKQIRQADVGRVVFASPVEAVRALMDRVHAERNTAESNLYRINQRMEAVESLSRRVRAEAKRLDAQPSSAAVAAESRKLC